MYIASALVTSPEKQKQQDVCVYKEIYFKEWAHVIMEAWQIQNLMEWASR